MAMIEDSDKRGGRYSNAHVLSCDMCFLQVLACTPKSRWLWPNRQKNTKKDSGRRQYDYLRDSLPAMLIQHTLTTNKWEITTRTNMS